jgi:methylthioribose-1-phosphate isomerase
MAAAEEALGPEPDGDALAEALRAEADRIALRLQADLDAVAEHLAALLAEADATVASASVPSRPLGVLVHGDPGALWGGLVGPGIAAIDRHGQAGHRIRVVLTEGRPFMEGARLAAWELRQAGVSHQLIADAAVAWLFERQPVDLVVVAAETIAANGDAAALVGSRAIAELAAAARGRHGAAAPRIVVLATGSTIDSARADAGALPDERRPVRELGSFLASAPAPGTDLLNPAVDVIPGDRIDVLVTESGPIASPTPGGVLAAARE